MSFLIGEEKRSVQKELSPWQRAALAHAHDADKEPDQACMHVPRCSAARYATSRSGRQATLASRRCSPA